MSNTIKQLQIAIIGTGPGGLTLARLLQQRGFAVTVYERDASRDARPQGGTLDLHDDSGQRAIRAMGLEQEFAAVSRPEGQATRLMNKSGRVLWDEVPEEGENFRPEIDRSTLRDLLMDSLLPQTILWDSQVVQLTALPNEKWLVATRDDRQNIYDLVVGCDGGSSQARAPLSSAVPIYSGVTYIESGIVSSDTAAPDISSLVGGGTLFALGDAKAIIAQRNGGGYLRLYIAFATEETWNKNCGIDFNVPASARTALLNLFVDWAPELRRLIEGTEDRFIARPLYRLPFAHHWQTRPGLTLLGDAAHLMTPFAGQGANLAMLDAVDLVDCLTDATFPSLTEALAAFEKTMLERSHHAATETQYNQELCFGPEAAERFAQQMQSYHAEASLVEDVS